MESKKKRGRSFIDHLSTPQHNGSADVNKVEIKQVKVKKTSKEQSQKKEKEKHKVNRWLMAIVQSQYRSFAERLYEQRLKNTLAVFREYCSNKKKQCQDIHSDEDVHV